MAHESVGIRHMGREIGGLGEHRVVVHRHRFVQGGGGQHPRGVQGRRVYGGRFCKTTERIGSTR